MPIEEVPPNKPSSSERVHVHGVDGAKGGVRHVSPRGVNGSSVREELKVRKDAFSVTMPASLLKNTLARIRNEGSSSQQDSHRATAAPTGRDSLTASAVSPRKRGQAAPTNRSLMHPSVQTPNPTAQKLSQSYASAANSSDKKPTTPTGARVFKNTLAG